MITENLSTLKIHKLTQAQYNRELSAGRIDENALYLTPDEKIDLSPYAKKEDVDIAVNNKFDSTLSMITLWENETPDEQFTAQDLSIASICDSDIYSYLVIMHNTGSEIIDNRAGNYHLNFHNIYGTSDDGVAISWYDRRITLSNGVISFSNCRITSLQHLDNTLIYEDMGNANLIPRKILGISNVIGL